MIHVRIPTVYRLMGLTALAVSLLVGGIILAARADPTSYRCLRFQELAYANPLIYDLRTGFYAQDKRPVLPLQRTIYQLNSPDGQYSAYTSDIPDVYPRLFIQPKDRAPVLVEQNVSIVYDMNWAHDSSWFAYVWGPPFETGQGPQISIVRPKADGKPAAGKRSKLLLAGKPVNDFTAHNWSADGQYFLFTTEEDPSLVYNFVSLPDLKSVEVRRPYFLLAGPIWSQESHKLAILEFEDRPGGRVQWLTIMSPEKGWATSVKLPSQMTSPQALWSPDGKYIALQYYDPPHLMLDLYSVDGTPRGTVSANLSNQYGILNHLAWSADGTAITYLEQQAGSDRTDLIAYRPIDQQYTVISKDVIRLPFYPVDTRQRMILMRQVDGNTAVDLVDNGRLRQTTIIDGADDVGDPDWATGGGMVALVWATGKGSQRVVKLTWIGDVDSEPHTLDDSYVDVRNLQWLDGGRKLAFVAVADKGSRVDLVDTTTGQLQRLIDVHAHIGPLSIDDKGTRLYIPWQDADGQAGIDVFTADGERLSRFQTSGPIDGLTLFLSPDNRLAAIKLGPRNNERLEVATSNGGPPKLIRSGLSGLGDPLWAPDSTKLAFTQSINHQPATLEVVGSDGTALNQINQFQGLYWELNWSTCD